MGSAGRRRHQRHDDEAVHDVQHYLRVKIFTDRGRETFASIDIPHEDNVLVQAVAARTSLPDGSAVELRESDVHERTVVKTEGLKVKMVSFAMPAVTTGAVIEYRWREVHMDSLASHLRLPVSRSVPVHSVHYDIRPLDIPGFQMRAVPFNSDGPRPERQRDGAMRVVRLDVAADRDEPHALPPFQQRPWVFIHYASADESLDRATYWKQFSKDLFEEYARTTKPNDAIRRMASSVPGAGTVSERVAALLKLARGSVERIDVDTADPAVRRKAKENRSAADALDRGQGTGSDVRVLFMALAKAAGLEARIVAVPNRSDVFHGPDRMNGYFVRDRLVAIGSGESRMFVDPANEYAEDGALQWWAEGQEVLVADPVAVVPAPTAISPASASARQRTAELRLAADGALEGDCRAAYTGHLAMALKEQEDQDAGPEREKALRDMVLARLPGAEIADPKVENVTSATGPYVNTYRLKVRNYAEQAGSRLFLQPAVFQKGDSPRFPSAKRFGPVYLFVPLERERPGHHRVASRLATRTGGAPGRGLLERGSLRSGDRHERRLATPRVQEEADGRTDAQDPPLHARGVPGRQGLLRSRLPERHADRFAPEEGGSSVTRRTAWLVAAAIAVPSLAWSAPPAWVRAIADRSLAQAETRDSALVLIDQADVVVSADGQVRTSRRYAIRLRDREARESAAVREVYISGSGRVLKMRGWLLRASGEVREYGAARPSTSRSR